MLPCCCFLKFHYFLHISSILGAADVDLIIESFCVVVQFFVHLFFFIFLCILLCTPVRFYYKYITEYYFGGVFALL